MASKAKGKGKNDKADVDDKASKKKGRKGNDDSDEDPLSVMKKLAQKDDSDNETGEKKSSSNKPQAGKDKGKDKDKDKDKLPPPISQPSKGKKGKKGRKGDSDDDENDEDPSAKVQKQIGNASESDDDDNKPKKNKDKGKGKETSSAPPNQPPKGKKGKKDKRKGDSDDDSDDEDPLAKMQKQLEEDDEDDRKQKKGKERVAPPAGKGKKGKKDRRKGDSDDDDEDPLAKMQKQLDDEDDDGEDIKQAKSKSKDKGKDKERNPPAPAAKGKKGKKGKGRGDSDEDDEDPLAKLQQQLEDEDEDEEVDKPKHSKNQNNKKEKEKGSAPPKQSAKGKKGKKDKRKYESDSEEDPLMKLQKSLDSDNEDEDDSEQAVQKTATSPISKPQNSKHGKKDKKSKGVPEQDESESVAARGKTKGKSKEAKTNDSDDENDDEDDDDDENTDSLVSKLAQVKVNDEAVEIPKPATIETPKKEQTAVKGSSVKSDRSLEGGDKEVDGIGINIGKETSPCKIQTNNPLEVNPTNSVGSKLDSVPIVAAASVQPSVPPQPSKPPAAAAAAAPVPPTKVKKSKLELKLEKLAKEKEAADLAAAEAERIRLEEAARAAEEARRKKEEEDAAAAAAAAALAAELALAKEAAGAEESSSDSEDEDDAEHSANAKGLTAEEEAKLMSTLYGDEVFSEYAKPGVGEEEGGGDMKVAIGKKEKLSNKAKRKLAKEQEAKDREDEYNRVAMKASIEGAQFAVSQSVIDPNDPQWQNALDIIIPNISISAHKKELFINTEFNIVHGRRYGLVGPNGAGKSTLLKMIAYGELKVPPRVDYLYVEQEVLADDTPAVDAVLKADKVRWALLQEEKQILSELEKKADEAKDVRLGEIYEQLAQIGAASAESKARRILFGLGFDREMQVRPTKYFSGGWRMRISLARALFIEPTLLMLDEPTNHLDLNAVIWLDDYLQRWKKTLLIVSHDQDFLNSVCQEVIHLDDKKLVYYKGNYDSFKEQEALKVKQQLKDWEKQEKKLRELKAKGITQKNAEKVQLKSKAREPGARSKKQEAAAMSMGGVESGESQVQLIKRPREYLVVFSFPEVVHLSPPIIEVRDVHFRYGPTLPWLFRGLNFGVDMNSRICIVGANGSGKSTVIKLITEELKPPEGEIRRNPKLRVGVYNQHFVDRLPMEEDPVTYLRRLFNEETYQTCRNRLGKYGLEGHAHTIPIRDLSGGQKARVVFVELSLMAPHLLFLDEPTNNLDIESIDALCIALKEFNGGVIMVSHDARLIESTNCQLWVVEDQNVTPWQEGFADYREHLLRKLEEQLAAIMPGSGERPTTT